MSARRAARIELAHVTKRYGTVTAVRDVSFEIAAGSLVTLLGPSGCGKTTTLRLIAGLESVTSGRILIGDDDVTALGATDRSVSMVFQSYALFPHMSVLENVEYGPRAAGRSRREAEQSAREALAGVGLAELAGRLPSELSGGQQQRVAIARALVLEPRVLLFDEPLSNLDARLRADMRLELRELQHRLGITSVYVTHDLEEALAMSDRIVVMRDGLIEQVGTPGEIYNLPRNAFVASWDPPI
jgi:iron(III) transport system ATP-binding protein